MYTVFLKFLSYAKNLVKGLDTIYNAAIFEEFLHVKYVSLWFPGNYWLGKKILVLVAMIFWFSL